MQPKQKINKTKLKGKKMKFDLVNATVKGDHNTTK